MIKTKEVIEIIRKEMKKQQLSFEELAGMAECSSRAIRYWLDGERTISLDKADKILNVLGITVTIGK